MEDNEKLKNKLKTAIIQYNAVVKQNKNLQKELKSYKKLLEETHELLKEIYEESEADTYIARSYDLIIKIEDILRKYRA